MYSRADLLWLLYPKFTFSSFRPQIILSVHILICGRFLSVLRTNPSNLKTSANLVSFADKMRFCEHRVFRRHKRHPNMHCKQSAKIVTFVDKRRPQFKNSVNVVIFRLMDKKLPYFKKICEYCDFLKQQKTAVKCIVIIVF